MTAPPQQPTPPRTPVAGSAKQIPIDLTADEDTMMPTPISLQRGLTPAISNFKSGCNNPDTRKRVASTVVNTTAQSNKRQNFIGINHQTPVQHVQISPAATQALFADQKKQRDTQVKQRQQRAAQASIAQAWAAPQQDGNPQMPVYQRLQPNVGISAIFSTVQQQNELPQTPVNQGLQTPNVGIPAIFSTVQQQKTPDSTKEMEIRKSAVEQRVAKEKEIRKAALDQHIAEEKAQEKRIQEAAVAKQQREEAKRAAETMTKAEKKRAAVGAKREAGAAADFARAQLQHQTGLLEREKRRVRKVQLKHDPSALYRHYLEYIRFFPPDYQGGEDRNLYLEKLLANRTIPKHDPECDLALAISYAKENWEMSLQHPRDVADAAKWQKEKLAKIAAGGTQSAQH